MHTPFLRSRPYFLLSHHLRESLSTMTGSSAVPLSIVLEGGGGSKVQADGECEYVT